MSYRITAANFLSSFGLDGQAFPVRGKVATGWRAALESGEPGVQYSLHWADATGWAIAPHKDSLLAILDVDAPEHPLIAQILNELPVLRDTLIVGRGTHRHYYLYLAYQVMQATIKVTRGHTVGFEEFFTSDSATLQEEIVSLRGYGAYVVGAGSQHPDGDRYELLQARLPARLSVAQTDKLLQLLRPHLPPATSQDDSPTPSPDDPDSAIRVDHHKPTAQPPAPRARSVGTARRVNPRLVAAIVRALESREGRRLVFRKSGPYLTASLYRNPTRDDDRNRSAYFIFEQCSVYDRATGLLWRTVDLCNYFGIRMNDFGGLFDGSC